jgi:hypothetical protein
MFAASKSGRVAAAVATDPYFPYVPLLLETTSTNGQQNNTFLDSSTNNFTITRNGTPTQGSVTPYWPNGYWSNVFNGTTDYVNTPANAAFAFGTGDFTVECWMFITYPLGTTGQGRGVITSNRNAASSNTSLTLQHYNSKILFGTPNTDLITGTITLVINTWTHIAVSRSSGTLRLFVNGVLDTTVTGNTTNFSDTNAFAIGTDGLYLGYYFTGYISNARLVKGTAVYTAAFTPPTTPLTAITNTSLLTCQSNRFIDNSTNAFAITASGTPKVQAFQPFSPTASYTTAAYGGSGYFNGSSDYLTGAASTALAVGTNPFTIEMWIYFNSLASNPNEIFRTSNDSTAGRLVLYYASGSLQVVAAGGAGGTSASYTFVTGQWYHVAASRDSSNNQRLFVNGVLLATATSTNNYTQAGFNLGRSGAGTNYINAQVTDFRLVNGTAIYTAAFTPPTAPLTAVTNTSLLLNFTNAGIYDAAVQNNAITVGSAQASTTVSKWSPTSMKFNGTTDYLTIPTSPALNLNADFTVETWAYATTTTNAADQVFNYGNFVFMLYHIGTTWTVEVGNGSSNYFSLSGTASLNSWHYFAITRSTNTYTFWIDGVSASTTTNANAPATSGATLYISRRSSVNDQYFTGYIQDFRITKGYARTITTPTAAFPTR